MKNIKRLFIATIVCFSLSVVGVTASNLSPELYSTQDNYLNFNLSTPPYNGYTLSPWRKKQTLGQVQKITNVKNNPSYDELDVRLKYDAVGNTTGSQVGAWHILKTGANINFNASADSATLATGFYQMYVDSRAHYTKNTGTSGLWNLY